MHCCSCLRFGSSTSRVLISIVWSYGVSLTLGELPFGGVDTSAFNAGQVQLTGSVPLDGEQWPDSWLSSCFIMTHTCS